MLGVPGRDSGIYLYMGRLVLGGGVPYLNGWDHKPPLIYFINALGLWLGGGSWWGVWAVELLCLSAAVALGFSMLRRTFGTAPALFGCATVLVSLLVLLEGGNLTEEYALPFQIGSLFLFAQAESRQRYGWRGVLIGLCTAAAFLLRQNLIGTGAAIVLYLFFTRLRSRKIARLIKDAGAIAIGGVLGLAIGMGYLTAHGAMTQFWDQAFRFNFVYSGVTPLLRLFAFAEGLRTTGQSGLSVIALAGWFMGIWSLRSFGALPQTQRTLIGIALIEFPLECALASTSGRWYPHYYLCWLPSCLILAAFVAHVVVQGYGESASADGASDRPARLREACLVALVLAMAVLPAGRVFYQLARGDSLRRQAIDVVARETQAQDYVLMWGNEPLVNFLAHRQAPTRFFYQYALYMPGYERPELIEEFLQDLTLRPPQLIVDASHGNAIVPPLDPEARQRWAEQTGQVLLPEMDLVFRHIAANYDVIERVGSWPVYRRKSASAMERVPSTAGRAG